MAERLPANTLKLTVAALAAWFAYEGFVAQPYIPTKGDVPTIGYGSTHYEDGTRVRMSDLAISRERAEELAGGELDRTYATCVRKSLGDTPVSQVEFEVAVDFAGQYGCTNWSKSSMLRDLKAGDYAGHCAKYLRYRYAAGYDCSTPGNKRCYGVWARQLERYDACMGEQA